MINTKKEMKENQDEEVPYRVVELGSKPNSMEVDEMEELELGAQARALRGNGKLDLVSWGETEV
jgi:hypothetical protein